MARTPLVGRLALALVATAAALLLVEGVLSLAGAPRLAERLAGGARNAASGGDATTGADRTDPASTGADGALYASHLDPLVGYVLRRDTELDFRGQAITTDDLGLRARPGPPPSPDALRLVVLGDSVAFGSGLADEETLAARLEAHLAEARGPDARPVACWTVAMSGWNHRNAVQFLLDHFAAFDPDVVIYMPVSNDLNDTYGLWETGQRRAGYDPASADPLLPVSVEILFSYRTRHDAEDGLLSLLTPTPEMGPLALTSDISPESRRRYDENAASIAGLADFLQARGRRLALAQYRERTPFSGYAWFLRERLLDRGLELPEVPLFVNVRPSFGQPGNPHPNAEVVDVMAIWTAQFLLDQGWIDAGAGAPLPPVPDAYAALRAEPRSPGLVRHQARKARDDHRAALRATVDLDRAEGYAQVYGGLNADATVGTRMLLMLAAPGPRLAVTLAPVPAAAALYPVDVAVEVDGGPLGVVHVQPGGADDTVTAVFPLPARPASALDDAVEVRLRPARWTLVDDEAGARLVACRVVRISAAP